MPVHQPEDDAVARPELLRGQPRHQDVSQFLRVQARQVAAQVGAEPLAEMLRAEHGHDRLGPGGGVLHHVLQQFHHVEHLDTLVAQALRGDVVLLLGPGHPGHAGELQAVLRAGGDTQQLGAGTVG